jgi:uncharacterized protein (DUF952 family)
MVNYGYPMTLFFKLEFIKKLIEKECSIDLDQSGSAEDWAAVEQAYLQQACRLAIERCVPWVEHLAPTFSASVESVMARLLQDQMKDMIGIDAQLSVGLDGTDTDDFFPIAEEYFDDITGMWRTYFWPERDLAGMALVVQGLMESGPMICHILTADEWEGAKKNGVYTPTSLDAEGFIHCSTFSQVMRTANLFFKDQSNLVLLWICEEKVQAEIHYEDLAGEGMLFPHIYGAINLDAVAYTALLAPAKDGRFVFPKAFDEIRSKE